MATIAIIHGPNLNLLGTRETNIYGSMTLAKIEDRLREFAGAAHELRFFQSNHEGAIIDFIHGGNGRGLTGAIINPGGLTHSSVSLLDAIKSVDYPFVEVHLTNLHTREPFRRRSMISPGALGVIQGLGWHGYSAALRVLVERAR